MNADYISIAKKNIWWRDVKPLYEGGKIRFKVGTCGCDDIKLELSRGGPMCSDAFMRASPLYWTVIYNVYSHKKKKNIVQRDLIPDLLKILHF